MATAENPVKAKPKRRWLQFRVRTRLIVMLLACVGLGWVAIRLQRPRHQRMIVEEIIRLGGSVAYDYQLDSSGAYIYDGKPPGPNWLRELFGDDFFADVGFVKFGSPQVRDADLGCLDRLTHLRRLYLGGTQVTDAGLEHLPGLTELRSLRLSSTRVTDAGLKHLTGLTQLQHLDFQHTQVTGAGLAQLKWLTQLKTLNLGGHHETIEARDAGLSEVKRALPNVTISHAAFSLK